MLKLWNTATRSLVEFTPITPGKVGMYTCGPTVYFDAHIGNMRSYVFEDVLQRTLELEGYAVTRVMNITDVGHLTDDADAGDDKIEKAAASAGVTAWDIAKTYTERFIADASLLHIKLPAGPLLCKATDHIPEQIALVEELERKGFTYLTSDGVYFDTSKFPAYGALSGQKLEDKAEGARVEVNAEKRNKNDFALWKFSPKDAKRQMEWESPWGVGFPGWHIECSAMARKFLGQPFDIHCGGVDHIPVHHENEIAQSEAAYGTKLANLWMHNEFLLVDGQKMSKSLGNVYTVRDLIEKDFDPLALRMLFLGASYRQKQNFTWESLQAAQNALAKLRHVSRNLTRSSKLEARSSGRIELRDPSYELPLTDEFRSALEDDLNTPKALAVVWKLLDSDHSDAEKGATLVWMDHVLGLNLADNIGKPIEVPTEILALVAERETARAAKDWTASDALREEIASKGWTVEDTTTGARVYPRGM